MTTISHSNRTLDWRSAKDRTHEVKWAAAAALPESVAHVEKLLSLPNWHWTHDQGAEGSCVGHGTAMERAVSNTAQNRIFRVFMPIRRYDPIDIWNEAKKIDEWPDTNPGDDNGTSVHAGYDVCLNEGLSRVKTMQLVNGVPTPINARPRDLGEGVSAVRWASTTDEIRTAIALGIPVTIGINWYSNFDRPTSKPGYKLSWIGEGSLGTIRGGHCVCIYGASDKHQAVAIKNSWGRSYPLIWLPYTTMDRLINEQAEVALVTDR